MQSGCTSEKERSIGHGFLFWILDSTLRSWVNACFSKLHLGRVIYSNNTASHGSGKGRGLKRGRLKVTATKGCGVFSQAKKPFISS